jgi:hypothetical protein
MKKNRQKKMTTDSGVWNDVAEVHDLGGTVTHALFSAGSAPLRETSYAGEKARALSQNGCKTLSSKRQNDPMAGPPFLKQKYQNSRTPFRQIRRGGKCLQPLH